MSGRPLIAQTATPAKQFERTPLIGLRVDEPPLAGRSGSRSESMSNDAAVGLQPDAVEGQLDGQGPSSDRGIEFVAQGFEDLAGRVPVERPLR